VWSAPADLRGVPLEERRPPSEPVAHQSRRGFLTHWWSATTGTKVVCGSLRREAVARELDFDPQVCWFGGEVVELQWTAQDGRRRRWRPDFMVRTTSGVRQVVAITPEVIDASWEEKLSVLRQAAHGAGWLVRTRPCPTGVRRDNLETAASYRHPEPIEDEQACVQALLAAFTAPRPICQGAAASGLPGLLALDLAYRLVWRRRLDIDWQQPLLPTAPAWAAPGEPR
jgi:hypothetical protein